MQPQTARMADPDDRSPCLCRRVHQRADLSPVHLTVSPAQSRKILGIHGYFSAVDPAKTGYHTLSGDIPAVHPEFPVMVGCQHINLEKGPRIKKLLNPRSGREHAFVIKEPLLYIVLGAINDRLLLLL